MYNVTETCVGDGTFRIEALMSSMVRKERDGINGVNTGTEM